MSRETDTIMEDWERILDYAILVMKNAEMSFTNGRMMKKIAETNIENLKLTKSNATTETG